MSTSNGEDAFSVHMSQQVSDKLQDLIANSPRAPELLASLKRIIDRLERDPWNFGEQRYHLYAARIQVRIGVIAPIAVKYGVSMDRPDVYVADFIALAGA